MLYSVHVWLCLLLAVAASRPGDMSSFFLKAPKSVPRAGRAAPGDYEGFFLKTSKSVPRIGRRNGVQSNSFLNNPNQQLLPINEHFYTGLDYADDYNRHESPNNNLDNSYNSWDQIHKIDYYKKQIDDGRYAFNDHSNDPLYYYNHEYVHNDPDQFERLNEDFAKE